MADDAQYEYTSVEVFRGAEAKTIAKWRTDGWEVDSRDQGLLRTELTFRRVKPTTLGARARAAFNRLEPKAKQGLLAGAACVLVLLVISVGVITEKQAEGGTPALAASAAEAGAEDAPTEEPREAAVPEPAPTTPADPTIAPPAPQTPNTPLPEAPTTQAPAPQAPKTQAPAPVSPKPQAPAPAPAPKLEPQAVAPPASTSAYYQNCDAVRAAGADPIRTGDPGYSRKLDRDGDGIGCE